MVLIGVRGFRFWELSYCSIDVWSKLVLNLGMTKTKGNL